MYSAQVTKVYWKGVSLLADVSFSDDDNKHPAFKDTVDVTNMSICDVKADLCKRAQHYESHGDLLVGLNQLVDSGEKLTPAPEELACGDACPADKPSDPDAVDDEEDPVADV